MTGKVLALPRRLARPLPPGDLGPEEFRPAPELETWAREVFITEGGLLRNERYEPLINAEIGMLWTSMGNSRGGRSIVGQAEIMPPMAMGKWQKGRAVWQMYQWFDGLPDFVITFDAGYCDSVDDASFCALVEHELHHCGQEVDQYGMPRFRQDGSPKFGIIGHDVEEFVGVVARYGMAATGVTALVEAANRGPTIAAASIAQVCGTCQTRRRA